MFNQVITGIKLPVEISRKIKKSTLKLSVPVTNYRSIQVPGLDHVKMGVCFVKVTDLPSALEDYMQVNPRIPQRTKKGLMTGQVAKDILKTLRESPKEMALKNRGLNLLVEESHYSGDGRLHLTLSDSSRHGIVDGGHTFCAIREAIEMGNEEELKALEHAYVKVNLFQGVKPSFVSDIAEGLNRSRQVDDPSLLNLQGNFDVIQNTLKGVKGSESIAYHQGDTGSTYVSEILVYLAMFNQSRYDSKKHPNNLYHKQSLGIKYYIEDMATKEDYMKSLILKLPEILVLSDTIKKLTPVAAKNNGFKFGLVKVGAKRAGSPTDKEFPLPFLGETMAYRIPNGWVYPMLAAFRANLKTSYDSKFTQWRMPLDKLIPEVIDDLVAVCISEHRDNNMRPDAIGKKESSYRSCYKTVELYLAKKNLL